ncbi:hypothetical protein FA15DRAFT_621788 [Coprinopsis marcescibilis]|uniref:F-box domain-containing protein n=1 Tax=Coprinopsis marcescibilis TaxID=230819 RepID=A0A5C3KRS7_COPMA|nr:hypothetical protein FA15DRAFT_621788 [Coprinopsis marcescibilis]
MDLTLEAYSNIVEYVGRRSDIAALCRVSKPLRRAAEKRLYKTIYLEDTHDTRSLCVTLANSPRLASLVESFTLSPLEYDESDDEDDIGPGDVEELPEGYWSWISKALKNMRGLKHLDIHSQNGPTSACAWIYPKGQVFLLHTLYCDFDWDNDLAEFINSQDALEDLYILDFKTSNTPPIDATDTNPATERTIYTTVNDSAMPKLTILECTFSEAADTIVPHRPITRLKTCFSRTEPAAKGEELARLCRNISRSTEPFQSLDIADSSYSEAFSMELLRAVVETKATNTDLRYVGTLVLPIHGQERLQFYGLLMRLPLLRCIELEVSDWDPVPSTPAAFRALTNELRIYCPLITMVVFVHEFERTAVRVSQGFCAVDADVYTEHLWREI